MPEPRELYNIEAEEAVIGALLMDNGAFDRIVGQLSAEDFYLGDHQAIFRAISALFSEKKPVDVITVAVWLKDQGILIDRGAKPAHQYLLEIEQATPGAANINVYADVIRDRAMMRRLINTVLAIQGSVHSSNGLTGPQLVDAAQAQLMALTLQSKQGSDLRHISEFVDISIEEIDGAAQKSRAGQIAGLTTGLCDLDGYLNGIADSDLVVLGGRPSHGKTALALNIAEHVCFGLNLPVVFFSLEMTGAQLTKRIMASIAGIHGLRLKDGRLTDSDWVRLSEGVARMKPAPLFVSDTARLNSAQISAQCRRVHRQTGGIGLIVIDYLGLMDHGNSDNRASAIERTTGELKRLAKELSAPVLLLSQLNRGLESRPNKRPVMSDLRESGGVEQDADTILFVHRNYVYTQNPDEKYDAEIIIAKQRSGPIGLVSARYDPSRTRFHDAVGADQQAA
ncbi:MAG: replicative DNA helicase [Betaproteobacteria bacterium]|nr:replicative DNA helicase [Betaproteobacteria bacterium]